MYSIFELEKANHRSRVVWQPCDSDETFDLNGTKKFFAHDIMTFWVLKMFSEIRGAQRTLNHDHTTTISVSYIRIYDKRLQLAAEHMSRNNTVHIYIYEAKSQVVNRFGPMLSILGYFGVL